MLSSITFSIVHLYLLKEMSTYLVIIQIEQVHFLFSIYSLPKIIIHFCVNCVNIYKLLLRGSVFRVNIYCILRQEPLQKTLCESILFIFSPYCTRCSLMRIKLSCPVLRAREETRCRHKGYSFLLSARVLFYMPHPTDRIAHTTACVTPVVEHWLEREIVQCVHHTGSIRRPIAPRTDVLPRSYISLLLNSRMYGYIKNIYIIWLC